MTFRRLERAESRFNHEEARRLQGVPKVERAGIEPATSGLQSGAV